MLRRLVPVLVAVLAFSVAADTASARALSKHAALVKTGKLAKKVAAESDAS